MTQTKAQGKSKEKWANPQGFCLPPGPAFFLSLVTKAEGPKWHLKSHSRKKTKLQPTMDSGRI
jgi:hypothetical protein